MFDVRELNIAIELWCAVFCVVGIISTALTGSNDRVYRKLPLIMFSVEMVTAGGDAMAGIFRGEPGTLAWIATHVGNFCTFAGNFALAGVITSYFRSRVEEAGGTWPRGWNRLVWGGVLVMTLLTALGTFYRIDQDNIYHRSHLYGIALAFTFVVGVVNAWLPLRERGHLPAITLACLLFYAIAPIIALGVQVFVYGLNFIVVVEMIAIVTLFVELQRHVSQVLLEQAQELSRAQIELSESRIAVMVSQIQPHFLFNTLDSIYYLCSENPQRAQEAVDRFSNYLRTNLASLSRTSPVPIDTELAHTRTYLELEELSMEHLLRWEIDAQADGFFVPALSLQTLAENAVKHGVGRRPGGGTIVVSTREEPTCWIATVSDDGVGFDTDAQAAEGHVGLDNTRRRLEAMCNGTLEVISKPGAGTTATIRIPKEAGL